MTFYTAILSLALAGPSQISDSYFVRGTQRASESLFSPLSLSRKV